MHPIASYTVTGDPIIISLNSEREMLLANAAQLLAAFIILENKMRTKERQQEVGGGMAQEYASLGALS